RRRVTHEYGRGGVRRWHRLSLGTAAAAAQALEPAEETGLFEQRIGEADALVRDAAKPDTARRERIERLDDAGIKTAAHEEVVRVAARKLIEHRFDESLECVRAGPGDRKSVVQGKRV